MMKRQRAFKPLTLKLSSIADAPARHAIETLFDRFNVERTRSNEAACKAALADAESSIAMQQARMAFVQLLLEAGELLGIKQPRVSLLLHNRSGNFSLERLMDFLIALGNDVEIRVTRTRKPHGQMSVVVAA